jgi:predicted transcriptional regulator
MIEQQGRETGESMRRHGGVARLGDLERAVMEVVWSATRDGAHAGGLTVHDVEAALPDYAYTTLLTVLGRLEKKGFLRRERDTRTHLYIPLGSRESYAAELMAEALQGADDQEAAVVHFLSITSPDQAARIRAALDRSDVRQLRSRPS